MLVLRILPLFSLAFTFLLWPLIISVTFKIEFKEAHFVVKATQINDPVSCLRLNRLATFIRHPQLAYPFLVILFLDIGGSSSPHPWVCLHYSW